MCKQRNVGIWLTEYSDSGLSGVLWYCSQLALRGKLHLSGSQNEGNAQHESDTRGPHGPLLTKGVVTPQDGGGHEPVLFSAGGCSRDGG